ncbi:DNA-binding XRE family transcriptional regulator [Dinghuibacter silviterrae]|uniref:DNA-binding XRE family transcriptional regulator n=2 Tax=Dinghuibacter silviterrae TaxID=1539049 RepID=A0A4R8DES6_9BACT|nr:DNA-binding XRE family transcriptional regulator [Dinghuibacter silviterrae]
MREFMIKIGAILRERRELLGLLQTQLADLSRISIRTIQLVERGKGNPSLDTLVKLAETLGMQFELVLKDPSKNGNV